MQRLVLRFTLLIVLLGAGFLTKTYAERSYAASPAILGGTRLGQLGLEYVAQVDQNDVAFSGYGYFTHIQGLNDKALFSNGDILSHTEANAYFTIVVTGTTVNRTPISRADVATIHSLDIVGTASFYYNATPSADFSTPASFQRGKRIASFAIRLHDALNVLSPNHGVVTGNGEVTQRTAPLFTIGGHRYRFSKVGRVFRMSVSGGAVRIDVPRSITILAGDFFVTR